MATAAPSNRGIPTMKMADRQAVPEMLLRVSPMAIDWHPGQEPHETTKDKCRKDALKIGLCSLGH